MHITNNDSKGYVYILEVADIDLPVCKIGMTRRHPVIRCAEINSGASGDFRWDVAHIFAVDDCRALESLIHRKLGPIRQRKREFFNVAPDDALAAVKSILEAQDLIEEIPLTDLEPTPGSESGSAMKRHSSKRKFKQIDSAYAEVLLEFASILNVKGRPFGQLNQPITGVSDGNEGVQWNIAIWTALDEIRLGVNLEGMKYENWPIATFIMAELDNPQIAQVASETDVPENINVRFKRDAWQAASRPRIVEEYLGGRQFTLAEMNTNTWCNVLAEALACLDENKGYRARTRQAVTLQKQPKTGERVRTMPVSPHLTVWTPVRLTDDPSSELTRCMARLQPVYDWVRRVSRTKR